ncbi:MAG: DUF2845 domain-containing protein [Hyphomicrobiales bacterium]|nr:MAG: DUF2845 domain-containing protein [Hyphomicrobiales bacterium]
MTGRLAAKAAGRLAAGALACAASACPAFAFTCGARLVTEGLSAYEVLKICGPPAWISAPANPIEQEAWIYDFGPRNSSED